METGELRTGRKKLALLSLTISILSLTTAWAGDILDIPLTGDIQSVKQLLRRGSDINARDEQWETPLHRSLRARQYELSRFLLLEGADSTLRTRTGETPLHYLMKYANSSLPGKKSLRDEPALITGLADLMIQKGADVNARDERGNTPLHYCAQYTGNTDFYTKILLARGARTSIMNNKGETPLHTAARYDRLESFSNLWSGGIDPLFSSGTGSTPLHYAAEYNSLRIMKYLLENGQSENILNIRDKNGMTPLHLAVLRGSVQSARLLINAGAGIDEKDSYGRTPLHWAVFTGRTGCVSLLLEKQANPVLEDNIGRKPADYLHKLPEKTKQEIHAILSAFQNDYDFYRR